MRTNISFLILHSSTPGSSVDQDLTYTGRSCLLSPERRLFMDTSGGGGLRPRIIGVPAILLD